ncbi:MAG: acyltransferase [Flavobacteriales bacterium]|nr:acyltransferase [Flavobacteriales bacterium]
MSAPRVYFPGLNGLRFFAAFAVVVTHVELMKKYMGYNNQWINPEPVVTQYPLHHIQSGELTWLQPLVAALGPLGVVFFFVLSGFLITYLLLVEREQAGFISVKNFYLRRIFRIWPLYYLLFILGFFVLPHIDFFYVSGQTEQLKEHFWGNFWSYLFIFPNLGFAMYEAAVPNIGQSWSIGVEEQFYLIWPLIIRYFKKPLHAIVWVTVILLIVKAGVVLSYQHYNPHWLLVVKKFLAMSKIECMTIGALGAWLLYYKKDHILKVIRSMPAQILSYSGIVALIFLTPAFIQDGIHLVYGVLFLIVIINVSTNPSSVVKLENKVFDLLGKISYGIYMYHLVVITFVLHAFHWLFPEIQHLGIMQGLALYIICTLLTIFVSWASYTWFEHRFIRMKHKFSKVISGDEAKQA